jgi:sec-independent protein translocase protein TatC
MRRRVISVTGVYRGIGRGGAVAARPVRDPTLTAMVEEPNSEGGKIERFAPRKTKPDPSAVMSLGEHLDELRRRLIHAIGGLIPIFVVGLIFGKFLMSLLMTPMEKALRNEGMNPQFMSTSVFEIFSTWIMIAFLVTVILGFPWIMYQVWKFIAPGLYTHERRFVHLLMPISIFLSVLGVLFMYFVALPAMLAFFIHFSTNVEPPSPGPIGVPQGVVVPTMVVLPGDPPAPAVGQWWFNETLGQIRMCVAIQNEVPVLRGVVLEKAASVVQKPRLGEYLNQFIMFGILFAVAFQTPVVILLLGWIRLVTVPILHKNRRMAIFIIAAISAVVTPPDPLSMMLLAIPLYVLFELGVLLLWMFPSPGRIGRRGPDDPEGKEGSGAEA